MEVSGAVPLVLVVIAAIVDLRSRRIPNVLTSLGAVAGLVFHAWAGGVAGLGQGVAGWATGIGLFLPLFLLGGMGAGDVKLLGAVGAWLGPLGALWGGFYSVLAGGVLALVVGAWYGYLGKAFTNLWALIGFWRAAGIRPLPGLTIADAPGPRVAYGVAIAVGTFCGRLVEIGGERGEPWIAMHAPFSSLASPSFWRARPRIWSIEPFKVSQRREVEVAHAFAVVAAHPLPLGAMLTAADVKLVPWPAASVVPGSFATIEEVVGRGIMDSVAENEPLTASNLATSQAGAGLPPTIPPGMRAISVKVNEVIGVAGFVVPGTRVDVMVILREGDGSLARVVVSNVQVLAAGTKYDQEVAKEGQAMPSTVVTLLVLPDDAERVGLASTQGQIMLTLRNPLDTAVTPSAGIRMANLASSAGSGAAAAPGPARVRRVAPPPPPVIEPPPPPKIYSVEVIRGAKRTEETIK